MKKRNILTAALALCAAPAFASSDADFARALRSIKPAMTLTAEAAPKVAAQPKAGGRVLSERTETVAVDLNDKTVKCSAADYQMPMLKVLVPGLADLTILNHRNTREGAPCIAAGRCAPNLNPRTLLDGRPAVEKIPVTVTLSKQTSLDGDVCRVTLVETVKTSIRGVPFFHERSQDVADRSAADCR